jgi:hypothetical protein
MAVNADEERCEDNGRDDCPAETSRWTLHALVPDEPHIPIATKGAGWTTISDRALHHIPCFASGFARFLVRALEDVGRFVASKPVSAHHLGMRSIKLDRVAGNKDSLRTTEFIALAE